MNKVAKFKSFLNGLKTGKNDTLIESLKTGFKVCYESLPEWKERDYEECANCGSAVPRNNATKSGDAYYCSDCYEESPLFDRIVEKHGFSTCGLDANFSCEAVLLKGAPFQHGSIYLLDDEGEETATAIRFLIDEEKGEQNLEEIKTFDEMGEFESYYSQLMEAD